MANITYPTDKADGSHKPEAITIQPQHQWLNGIPQIASYTGCSRRKIQDFISNGLLPVKRLSSRHLLALASDVDELIDRLDAEYRSQIGEEV